MTQGMFAADPAGVAKAAPQIQDLGHHLEQLGLQMGRATETINAAFGNDQIGDAFRNQLAPGHEQMFAGLQSAGKLMSSTADGVNTAAEMLARGELANANVLKGVSGSSGGDTGGLSNGTTSSDTGGGTTVGSSSNTHTSGGTHS